MSKISDFCNSLRNSGFPNITETYKCKFDGFQTIVSGERKFNLLIVSATDANDVTNRLSTIVEKTGTPPEDIINELFTVRTEQREDSKYPKVIFED